MNYCIIHSVLGTWMMVIPLSGVCTRYFILHIPDTGLGAWESGYLGLSWTPNSGLRTWYLELGTWDLGLRTQPMVIPDSGTGKYFMLHIPDCGPQTWYLVLGCRHMNVNYT
jgi:hypothetical protein